jgi:hypothetical protein
MESVEITDSIDNENSDTNFPRADDNMERLSKEGGTVVASNNNNYYYNNTGGGDIIHTNRRTKSMKIAT